MNLFVNNYNNSRYKMQHYNIKKHAAQKATPPNSQNQNNISFKANIEKIVEKSKTTYNNAGEIIQKIDETLGEKFFSNIIDGLNDKDLSKGIKYENNVLEVKNSSILQDTFSTCSYPFKDLWLDLGNSVANGLKKIPFLKGIGEFMQKEGGVLQKRLQRAKDEDNIALVRNILEAFSNASSSDDINKCAEGFKRKASLGITKIAKNYNSRDERTLNRMVTSTVSALYSANDFYNISMLQKDDKKEANKSSKGRFKQEMTRMAISAGLTFTTLGILDKYLKKNIVVNAIVIAGSSLLSEVVSRIANHNPLYPISPEQAAKIAKKRNIQTTQESKPKNNKINFKSNEQAKLFSQFTQNDKTFTSLNSMTNQIAKENPSTSSKNNKKKGLTLGKIIALTTLGCNALYFVLKAKKGEFSSKTQRKALYTIEGNKEKIKDFIDSKGASKLDEAIANGLEEISNNEKATQEKAKILNFLSNIKKRFTKTEQEIDLNDLRQNINSLIQKTNTEEGNELGSILEQYLLDFNGKEKITAELKNPLRSGLFDGVTKIFKTVYEILSAPAAGVNAIINKVKYKDSETAFNIIDKMGKNKKSTKELAEQAAELHQLFKKYDINNEKECSKLIETIKKNTRNFETSAETGELANLSRTMVTAISTWFFVSDYRNKVLIESGGKNIDEANEVTRERIMHKVANFIFNGTLMNTFNSIFKVPLNNSLAQAALIAATTETTNEFLIRKSICQPIKRMNSKQSILDYEEKQIQRTGFMGWWSRTFKKITGKKALSQKAGINNNSNSNNQTKIKN